ncbi:MAG TPA: histidinol-phosphate transaminase [Arenimonas sp.]|uniref:histidinol-phosphate transaminase n=1 Tax=Arenimonas sp. TaxID=1872635 RepID=UPI002D7F53C9|nr:histidinol-phosphate transaminase [Arenimonas sp.]HEU0153805.1 histidinol-phosphate transaminase [Arenimonas sp.]
MSAILSLVREDLREFAGYSSARRAGVTGSVWLNANESAWRNPADAGLGANRYPDPQPAVLRERLGEIYGVRADQVLVGRGSDEAIDLLVRALCVPGRDAVVVSPPVFGMYAVSARLQGAPLVEVPLRDTEAGFASDLNALADAAVSSGAKLVFVCSPANPTGQAIPPAELLALARRLAGRCLVVVDEAYGEYSDQPSVAGFINEQPNLAVLRTLSKAHALAAARIGCLLAAPELVAVLRNCQAPYPLPSPCVQLALAGLSAPALAQTDSRVITVRAERERLQHELAAVPGVRRVYRSQGNYILVRFEDAGAAFARLLAAGVVVRDMRAAPQLADALRISVGSPAENDAMMAALQAGRAAA